MLELRAKRDSWYRKFMVRECCTEGGKGKPLSLNWIARKDAEAF